MGNRKTFACLRATFFVLLVLALASCSHSPVNKALRAIDKATANIENCDDIYELLGNANALQQELNVINSSNRNYEPTTEEAERLRNKINEYTRAYLKRTAELSGLGTNQSQQTQEIIDKILPRQQY